MEKEYNIKNFESYCGEISEKLAKFLNKNNILCEVMWGQYCNASLSYIPNIDPMLHDEEFDEDQFWIDYYEAQDNNQPLCYAHFWVETKDGYIIDITADQFHPDNKEKYKIIYTKNKNGYI